VVPSPKFHCELAIVPSGSLLVLLKVQASPLQLEVNAAVGGWFPGPAPAALRERTDASHVLGWLKNQVHCGSTVPAAPCMAYSPSAFMEASDSVLTFEKPGGGSRPTTPFDSVTPYASAPALIAMAPGSATVVDEPEPDADRCAPKAWAKPAWTPL
jgi:hypothetical protein